jgi:hypothetical protein
VIPSEEYREFFVAAGVGTAMSTLSYVLIGDLLVGISRAWQLVGLRDTGLLTSLRILAGFGSATDVADQEPAAE